MESNKEIENHAAEQPLQAAEQPAETPRRRPNKLGRWAFVVALAAWALFIISGFLPYDASLACGAASGVTAAVAFVMGLVSLRRSPRGASTAALVFSGVIVIIFVIVIIGVDMLKSIPSA